MSAVVPWVLCAVAVGVAVYLAVRRGGLSRRATRGHRIPAPPLDAMMALELKFHGEGG